MVLSATEPSPQSRRFSAVHDFVRQSRNLRARGHLSKNQFVTAGSLTCRDSLTNQRGQLGEADRPGRCSVPLMAATARWRGRPDSIGVAGSHARTRLATTCRWLASSCAIRRAKRPLSRSVAHREPRAQRTRTALARGTSGGYAEGRINDVLERLYLRLSVRCAVAPGVRPCSRLTAARR